MRILVADVGGTHVKLLATGRTERVTLDSRPSLTPATTAAVVRAATRDWAYDVVVSVGCPGPA